MKIACDTCGTEHPVTDEQVRGGDLAISCICGRLMFAGAASDPGETYHVRLDGELVGPLTLADLREAFATGEIDEFTPVLRTATAAWVSLCDLEGFRTSQPTGPPPPALGRPTAEPENDGLEAARSHALTRAAVFGQPRQPGPGDHPPGRPTWTGPSVPLRFRARLRELPPPRAASGLAHARPASPTVSLLADAPRQAFAGEPFLVKFVACDPRHEPAMRARLQARPGDHGLQADAAAAWPPGALVEVRVRGDRLTFVPDVHRFVWNGEIETHDFEATADGELLVLMTSTIAIDVAIDGLVVARVRLPIALQRRGGWLGAVVHWLLRMFAARQTVTVCACLTAFASYDARDTLAVAHRVLALERSSGIRCVVRCLAIDDRDDRKPAILADIGGSDLFILFWSPHAASSPAVDWGWHEALRLKGTATMQAQLLGPDPPPLPGPLTDLAPTAPTPIDEPVSPVHALEQLLTTLFTAAELRRWLAHHPDDPGLLALLPGESTPLAELAHQVVRLCMRKNLVDAALFDRLARDIPRQSDLIDHVRRRWC